MRFKSPALTPKCLCQIFAAAALAAVVSGCGSTGQQNGLTTSSLRPQPGPGVMQQRPERYQPYPAASAAGAPPYQTANTMPYSAGQTGSQPGYKTYQYPWNGNRERIHTGAAWQPTATPAPASNVTWKASPTAPAAGMQLAKGPYAGREIVVAPGDTLYSLAARHDVAVASLMQANHLQSPVIQVSQRLVLPATGR